MKALIIINKYSGVTKNKEIDYISRKIRIKYNIIDIYESKNDIKEYVIRYASFYDLLIIIGGDGTFNQTVNGIMLLSNKPKVAYIPMGTCNDFGRSIGLKMSLDKVVKGIILDESKMININSINTDYYVYGLAIGNMTNVSFKINQRLKRVFGKLAYYLNAVKHLFINYDFELELTIDEKKINRKCFCLMLLNTYYLASLKLKFKEDYINNDKVKIVLINKKNRLVNIFDLIMFFLLGERYTHNIEYLEGNNIVIKTDKPMRCNIDGECLPLLDNIKVNRIRNVINLIVYNN